MGDKSSSGVVLVQGRTRIWVTDGAVHWQRGREHTVVPGAWVRRVGHDGGKLTLELFDDTSLTAQHRLPEVAQALAREIEPLIGDGPGPGDRPPIRDVTPAPASVRAVQAVVKWAKETWYFAEPFQRFLICYGILGLPLALLLARGPLALVAWATFPLGLGLVRWSRKVFNPLTYWAVWRRGVIVRADFTADYSSGAMMGTYWAEFRTLEGRRRKEHVRWENRRNEVRYDLRNPERVISPTRVMWLGDLLWTLFVGGLIGLGLMTPYVWILVWWLVYLLS